MRRNAAGGSFFIYFWAGKLVLQLIDYPESPEKKSITIELLIMETILPRGWGVGNGKIPRYKTQTQHNKHNIEI